MLRVFVLLGFAALMFLPACAMWDSDRERQQEPVAVAPAQDIERQAEVAEQDIERQAEMAEQQQRQETTEFMGVAPKVEDIPETIVLEAKNGNVTLSHQKHAKTMDCATCHQGAPGKIPGFDKDKAHALCTGCHKEKNAGPTKCGECHKK